MAPPVHPREPADVKPLPPPSVRFVARQPILTADEKVFGYELLFRDGVENYFNATDPEAAARSTLDSSLLLGLDVLCDRRYAFINCTREVLLKDYVVLLPPKQAVIELLESIPPDAEVVSACKRLKQAGYLIALDDFVAHDPRHCLTELADIIKVDLRATTPGEQAAIVRRFGGRSRMLAEKVETRDEFQATRQMGFVYFQGYFFCRPEVVTAQDIPSNRLNYILMLQAVARPELDIPELEKLIKSEASVCYRLLRYLNSSLFCLENEIHSVRHALSLLGERQVRRWIQLVAIIAAGEQKSSEVVFTALVRARFCELLAPRVRHGDSELFLMGLMSLMDTILQMPMSQLLEHVPLDKPIKNVLLGEPSHLRSVYRLMLAQESGEWEAAAELSRLLNLGKDEVPDFYWQALQWAHGVSGRS
ncbi:MAG: EAL domain-containing protein [Acidobacteriia bacterium]|nr:EAL domain-containing protein [Terriglobia bacterium]